ncbi:helix-turn-helix transcriptional regulator [Weissella ceti]|uniref:Helix-turn-helix transcriptional regulator n=1 Tax=Weissella ceti TaxID=759620 RepID=A0ABT3E5R9_9LACO|nr:helix-turn-helix transcriptional regulator [Weissella ceti]MCW0953759.1 helix-turn-helix transcriptional regulator [Weissella ceti]QVK11408.1 helix-turn-helix transcriptional regulator [Weissella ceti]
MNRIKELRQGTGKQQKEVANELHIPVSTYAGYERGEREPKLDVWKKLAGYFDVDVPYLQDISDERNLEKRKNWIKLEKNKNTKEYRQEKWETQQEDLKRDLLSNFDDLLTVLSFTDENIVDINKEFGTDFDRKWELIRIVDYVLHYELRLNKEYPDATDYEERQEELWDILDGLYAKNLKKLVSEKGISDIVKD